MKIKEKISINEFDGKRFQIKLVEPVGVPLSGRALRSNLFARSSQKGFPLQSLTQHAA